MRYQRGMSLGKLLVIIVAVGVAALLAMKVIPGYIEYYKITKSVKATAQEFADGKPATVEQVRQAYNRRSGIDMVTAVKGADLDITKEGNNVVISFDYQNEVPLFANVSLLFKFKGSSPK